jgi:hypothetical protein
MPDYPNNADNARLADEIYMLLQLSKCFSETFRIKRERVRQWRFVGMVVELEIDSMIYYRDLLESEEIEDLIQDGKAKYARYYWVNKFVREFANERPFTERLRPAHKRFIKGEKKDLDSGSPPDEPRMARFKLNDHFYSCLYGYVSEFTKVVIPDVVSDLQFNSLTNKSKNDLFKELFLFQKRNYWPAWTDVVSDVKSVASAKKVSINDRFFGKSDILVWVISLIHWIEYLRSPNTILDTFDINQKITDNLRFADPGDTLKCIRSLSDETGRKPLLRNKSDGEPQYHFNSVYSDAFYRYSLRVVRINSDLKDFLSDYMRMQLLPRGCSTP